MNVATANTRSSCLYLFVWVVRYIYESTMVRARLRSHFIFTSLPYYKLFVHVLIPVVVVNKETPYYTDENRQSVWGKPA